MTLYVCVYVCVTVCVCACDSVDVCIARCEKILCFFKDDLVIVL